MQSRQLWNTGPLYMCAVGCCEVADACGVPCRLSLSRLFIYLLITYLEPRLAKTHEHPRHCQLALAFLSEQPLAKQEIALAVDLLTAGCWHATNASLRVATDASLSHRHAWA